MVNLSRDRDDDLFHIKKRHHNNAPFYKSNSSRSSYYQSSSKAKDTCIVKITGHIESLSHFKKLLEYDLTDKEKKEQNKELELSDGFKYSKKDVHELIERVIKTTRKRDNSSLGYRLAFSMNGKQDPKKLREAVHQTLKKTIGFDNEYTLQIHTDTDHHHVHVSLFKHNFATGKNLDLNKRKLEELKVNFALELNKLGLNAKHSVNNKKPYDDYFYNKKEIRNTFLIKANLGKQPYLKNPKFERHTILAETSSGKVKLFQNDALAQKLKELDVEVGDRIRLKQLPNKEWQIIPIKQKNKMQEHFQVLSVDKYPLKDRDTYQVTLLTQKGEIVKSYAANYKKLKQGQVLTFETSKKEVSFKSCEDKTIINYFTKQQQERERKEQELKHYQDNLQELRSNKSQVIKTEFGNFSFDLSLTDENLKGLNDTGIVKVHHARLPKQEFNFKLFQDVQTYKKMCNSITNRLIEEHQETLTKKIIKSQGMKI